MATKTVIVLGGSSGIGKAIAKRFAREGYNVVIACEDIKKADQAISELQGKRKYLSCQADMKKKTEIESLAALIEKGFGKFDVLINSVGISEAHSVIDSDFDDWDNTLQVMMYGVIKSFRALIPLIKDNGRIINITSIHYMRVAEGSSAYGMAKAAITQFTRSLAVELAPKNILVNAIAPGFINTPMSVKKDIGNELETEWFKQKYIDNNHLPLKRAGNVDEVAGVAYFLAGKDSSYITGSVITVDGGLTITF